MNSVGTTLPPFYVYARIRNPDEYVNGALISSLAFGKRNGWMEGDVFIFVVEHIERYTKCTKEEFRNIVILG